MDSIDRGGQEAEREDVVEVGRYGRKIVSTQRVDDDIGAKGTTATAGSRETWLGSDGDPLDHVQFIGLSSAGPRVRRLSSDGGIER